ncbi:dynamin family protein [Lentzea atacamensis]|uniref:Dynamin family protein n=1 Tax=Lentzea atacamensis TaxID=531938 RepID=A0A316I2J9_9PSEU|nr:dynamin family protein [Lentzea atacamensis]PWK86884.1 dynamin family protein [Lentzea atacamensis]RAS67239.1 dynamin family protein [Lentzea atacamensis]
MTTTPIEAVDRALAAIARYERPDLEARLRQARARLQDDRVRLLVVGEFKQGKSMLVNGLLGAPACPVFDDVATSVPTVVRYAEQPVVTLVRGDSRIEVPVDQLAAYASESGNPDNKERLDHVEVGLPRPILGEGLELVDTPGVGGLGSVHGAATMSALPTADAVLLVSDASQEYTAPELEFLRHAVAVCPNVACVVTKTDLYPDWRFVAEQNQAHLEAAKIDLGGLSPSFFTVSSTLRWHALQTGDQDVNRESGYPPLVTYLRKKVLGEAESLARRSTAHDVHAVIDQIISSLRAEESAQSDPASAQALIDKLSVAEQRAAGLKERSARWQQTLSDGVADLNADVDYDLRDRMREIVREAEESIMDGDPTKIWDQLTKWVQDAAASAVSANSVWATQRARWLARRVAEHFDSEREQTLPSLQTSSGDPLRSVRALEVRSDEKFGVGGRFLSGLRGGYSGLLMFGLLGSAIGLSLINPISIGAAVLLGGKTIGDERKRIVQRRQNDAKAALRRYIDDVTFHAGKESRDVLRAMQRDLRDHFTALAEQLKRSLQESIQSAQKSVKASSEDRNARLKEIAAELAALEKIRAEVTP